MDLLNELSDFVRADSRLDVKTLALHHVLSMTGDFESRNLMLAHPKLLTNVVILAFKKDEQKLFEICYDEYFQVLNDKDKEAEMETKYVTFFVFSSGHIIMSSRPYNMEKYFYDVIKILIKNQAEFEEKADVRKVTKSKKTKRSKIEIEDD